MSRSFASTFLVCDKTGSWTNNADQVPAGTGATNPFALPSPDFGFTIVYTGGGETSMVLSFQLLDPGGGGSNFSDLVYASSGWDSGARIEFALVAVPSGTTSRKVIPSFPSATIAGGNWAVGGSECTMRIRAKPLGTTSGTTRLRIHGHFLVGG